MSCCLWILGAGGNADGICRRLLNGRYVCEMCSCHKAFCFSRIMAIVSFPKTIHAFISHALAVDDASGDDGIYGIAHLAKSR